jgi:adenylylsulfate kinase
MKHTGLTVWFTGLSGAGKTTISQQVGKNLIDRGYRVEYLDGDAVRQTLSKGMGFSKADRDENIRRIGFVANLLTRNNVIVLVSVISTYQEIRQEMRDYIDDFWEVYVCAPLATCHQRDVKGLYHKAENGEIANFTGITAAYKPPVNPEIICYTETVEESITKVLRSVLSELTEDSQDNFC